MTLIASIINHKVPFLMSDLLMSSKEGTDDFQSPSNIFTLKNYLPQSAGWKPDSLRQKSYILKDNLCISFAGIEEEIKEFLKELKIKCNYYDDITKENIFRILDDYDLAVNFGKSAFIMLLINKVSDAIMNVGIIKSPSSSNHWDTVKGKKGGWAYVENNTYGEVTAIGSGRDNFLNIVNENMKVFSGFEKGHIWHTFQMNMALIARMYAIEKATLHTILSHWGGGFETIFYDGNKFIKSQNIAFIINAGWFNENGDVNVPLPTTILYYRYYNDYLLITGIYLKDVHRIDEGSLITLISNIGSYEVKNAIVPRFDDEENDLDISNFDYNFCTSSIAMGYDIRKMGETGTYNPATFNIHNKLKITYKVNDSVKLVISKDINDKFRELAKEVYPKI
jgi:hypothetical protein